MAPYMFYSSPQCGQYNSHTHMRMSTFTYGNFHCQIIDAYIPTSGIMCTVIQYCLKIETISMQFNVNSKDGSPNFITQNII